MQTVSSRIWARVAVSTSDDVIPDTTNTTLALEYIIHEALYFDVAQGRINGAPNETRTHTSRFANQAC